MQQNSIKMQIESQLSTWETITELYFVTENHKKSKQCKDFKFA
jgi:hypothetical protein